MSDRNDRPEVVTSTSKRRPLMDHMNLQAGVFVASEGDVVLAFTCP